MHALDAGESCAWSVRTNNGNAKISNESNGLA